MLKRVIVALSSAIACLPGYSALAQATSADLSDIVIFACEGDADPIILQRLLGKQVLLVGDGLGFGDALQGGREVGEGVFVLQLPYGVARLDDEQLIYADGAELVSVDCKRIDRVYLNALESVLAQDWVSSLTARSFPIGAEAGAAILEAERVKQEAQSAKREAVLLGAQARELREQLHILRDEIEAYERVNRSGASATMSGDDLNSALARAAAIERRRKELAQDEVQRLTEQVSELSAQNAVLQGLLDEAQSRDQRFQVRLETLGSNLNAALARAAAEERRRRELESQGSSSAED